MSKKFYQIAIDGPAGAGKSTIAKLVAKKLDFIFINTGSMYRCIALGLNQLNWDHNEKTLINLLDKIEIDLFGDQYFLNQQNVTNEISNSKIASLASEIALNPIVRNKCIKKQQSIAKQVSVVMEGRDIGSVVLPHADLKIFLTASIQKRAERRKAQLNNSEDLKKIEEDIFKRDQLDINRPISPLTKTKDAIEINTDHCTIGDVVLKIINLFKEKIWQK